MMVSVANKLTQGSGMDSDLTQPDTIVAVLKNEKIVKMCEEWSGVTT